MLISSQVTLLTNKQTNKHTDKNRQKHNFPGGDLKVGLFPRLLPTLLANHPNEGWLAVSSPGLFTFMSPLNDKIKYEYL